MGGAHSNRSDFDDVPDAGCYYITGSTNGPGVNSATQYYGFTLGLGAHDPVAEGSNNGKYGCQIYWGRNVSNPYINLRYLENGAWGTWRKAAAGYADSAATASSCSGNAATATTATNQSGGTVSATTGYFSNYIYTDGNRSVIRGGSPTLYFRDTDHNSAMIHNNANLLYILRGGNDTESWTQVNGQWPWIFNLTNNDSTCGGSLYCVGNVTAYSDIRHKKDIVKLDDALEKVEKLNGYTYTRINDGKRYTGLIAQEVLEVLPEAVIADEKGDYSLAYGNMAGLLIEAIKELKLEIDELKKSR